MSVIFVVVFVTTSAVEVNLPAPYNIDLSDGAVTDVLAAAAIEVPFDIGVDRFVGADKILCAGRKATLECISILATSGETLLFGWKACSC